MLVNYFRELFILENDKIFELKKEISIILMEIYFLICKIFFENKTQSECPKELLLNLFELFDDTFKKTNLCKTDISRKISTICTECDKIEEEEF